MFAAIANSYCVFFFCSSESRAMFGLLLSATNKAHVFVLDTVRTNQMPNMNNLYQTERTNRFAVCVHVDGWVHD